MKIMLGTLNLTGHLVPTDGPGSKNEDGTWNGIVGALVKEINNSIESPDSVEISERDLHTSSPGNSHRGTGLHTESIPECGSRLQHPYRRGSHNNSLQ
ncbi:hypothetical protein SK128_009092 [Halocaridina rubra]|uniref:Uncharacterized protein n=1 Tax=Halocaridina rubra TaxID=373956 RepID=A0AAN8WVG0_HALRR